MSPSSSATRTCAISALGANPLKTLFKNASQELDYFAEGLLSDPEFYGACRFEHLTNPGRRRDADGSISVHEGEPNIMK